MKSLYSIQAHTLIKFLYFLKKSKKNINSTFLKYGNKRAVLYLKDDKRFETG